VSSATGLSRTVRNYFRGVGESRADRASGATVDAEAPDATRDAAAGAPSRRHRTPWLPAGVSLLALLLWGLSIPAVDLSKITGWGLLTGLPVLWYAAFVLALGAVVAVVTMQRDGPTPGSATVPRRTVLLPLAVLLVVLFATTAAAYDVPRYGWTYKHIGVTEYLLLHGVPATQLDIYQNFPGFFYVVGGLHETTGIPLLAMARYFELVAHALNAVAVYWALGALTRSHRVRVTSVVIFTLANWIGQSYFAPQALAFPASLFIVGAYLRLVAAGHFRPRQVRIVERLHRSDFWNRPVAVVLTTTVFAFTVVSHQFTPVALMFQLAVLTVLLQLRYPWLLLLFATIEGLWLLHAYPFISSHFALLEKVGYDNIRPPAALEPAVAGAEVMARFPHAITLLIALATLAAGVRVLWRDRRLTNVIVPAALAIAPGLMVAVQPYGQEGILRWYLFLLPWSSFVIARDLLSGRHTLDAVPARAVRAETAPSATERRLPAHVGPSGVPPLRNRVAVAAFVGVLGVCAVPATFGNEMLYHVRPSDVAANQWFEQNASVGSELMVMAPASPSRSTGRYDQHVSLDDPLEPRLLAEVEGFEEASDTSEELFEFTQAQVRAHSAQHDIYLALGPTQQAYLDYYGLVSDQVYNRYIERLKADDDFTLVYSQGDSYLFRTF
jgi:hypothetical protein